MMSNLVDGSRIAIDCESLKIEISQRVAYQNSKPSLNSLAAAILFFS
jgi:hypothetical protein